MDVGVVLERGATEGRRGDRGVPDIDVVGEIIGCAVECLRCDLRVAVVEVAATPVIES